MKYMVIFFLFLAGLGCDDEKTNPLANTEWHGNFGSYREYMDFQSYRLSKLSIDSGASCFEIPYEDGYQVQGSHLILTIGTIDFVKIKDSLYIIDNLGHRFGYKRLEIDDFTLADSVCVGKRSSRSIPDNGW